MILEVERNSEEIGLGLVSGLIRNGAVLGGDLVPFTYPFIFLIVFIIHFIVNIHSSKNIIINFLIN